jgi:alpha-ketoglutarate-dependent taurine dioxygenase
MKKLRNLSTVQPEATSFNQTKVSIFRLTTESGLAEYPIVLEPATEDVDVVEWVRINRQWVLSQVQEFGAVLFRNFYIHSLDGFREAAAAFSNDLIDYTQRSSPRTEIGSKVYTSTDYPADQHINMHNELSYSFEWPLYISFCCLIPPGEGGETPIADSRKIVGLLTEKTKTKFREKGILYRRNLREGFGLSWQEVFQTADKAIVDEYCRANGMRCTWKEDNQVLLEWKRDAIRQHPMTHEEIWFNHAYFFNTAARGTSFNGLRSEDVPFNTFYGDGSEIELEVIAELDEAYRNAQSIFSWQAGDWLLMDNMLMAHGRRPFSGQRKIVVAMSDPIR